MWQISAATLRLVYGFGLARYIFMHYGESLRGSVFDWSSNSNHALLRSSRAVAQTISTELFRLLFIFSYNLGDFFFRKIIYFSQYFPPFFSNICFMDS